VLNLQSDQKPERDIDGIRSLFKEIDPDVKVDPMSPESTYTITFKDTELALEALKLGKQMELTIARKFPPRPRPNHPIEYIALEDLLILKGKSLSQPYVGLLKKGQKVTVDQAKGRRVRLIKPNEKVKTWGWVSIYTDDGKPLLSQVNETEMGEL